MVGELYSGPTTTSDLINVLHVDDEPGFAEMSADFLEQVDDDITVTTATSTKEGLQLLATEEVDCIVSDYDMPHQTGIEFLNIVREDYPDLPFILFTGKGSEEVASEAISAGVTDYLQKESGTDQYEVLANRIRNYVQQAHTQRQLEEREAHLRQAHHIAGIGSWFKDIQSDEIYWSDGVYEIFGLDATETQLDHEQWLEFVHPDDREYADKAWQAALAGEEYDIQHRIRIADGDTRWVREFADIEFDADGNPIKAIGVVQDITEHKETEEQLQEAQTRYQQILHHLSDYVVIVDESGTISYASPAIERVTGYNPDEVIGTNAFEYVYPDHREIAESAFATTLETPEQDVQVEYRTITQDGTPRWIEARGGNYLDDPHIEGIMVSVRDITQRKKQEQERNRYETIVETSGDPVYTLDAEGHFTFVNDALVEFVGYDEDTLLGEHASMVMTQEHVERGEELIRTLLQTDRDQGRFEMDLITADGEHIPCENHVGVLPFDEEFQGTVGVLRDLTDRKERERELQRQNERLDEFASIVSHDLRNPLNVAQGQVELAREECASPHLDAVADAVDRSVSLLEDLLTLARTGEDMTEIEAVDLAATSTGCWQNVETAEATLVVETDQTIRADASRLQQLLENLLRNAIEHGGETVTVTIGDLDDNNGFYVADDGPGIPADDRSQVFEAGYSTTEGGTGFGLNIVQEITEAHDWEIRVTESETGGTCFEITGVTPAEE